MRFIHTSDWHLGRIFHGIHLTEDQAYVLDGFIDLVKDTKPDAILISGDIFDRSVPPTEAVNLLDDVLSRILMDYKVPILMISGNHDSGERLGFGYRLLGDRGLKILGKLDLERNGTVIRDQYGDVNFHLLPYVEPALVRERLEDQDIHHHDHSMDKLTRVLKSKIRPNSRNVLLAHAFVAGGEESESERPLSVGGSGVVNSSYFKDFNYVALGHLHRPQRVGDDKIRYSGSLMKYSFAEANHNKSVTFVEMDELGNVGIEAVEIRPRRDLRCIEGYLDDILKGPQKGESREDYIMITLKDEGAILDAVGKLRKVYPNVLHIERPQFSAGRDLCGPDKNYRNMNEVELFSSFFNQVTGQSITDTHRQYFERILENYYNREKEVAACDR